MSEDEKRIDRIVKEQGRKDEFKRLAEEADIDPEGVKHINKFLENLGKAAKGNVRGVADASFNFAQLAAEPAVTMFSQATAQILGAFQAGMAETWAKLGELFGLMMPTITDLATEVGKLTSDAIEPVIDEVKDWKDEIKLVIDAVKDLTKYLRQLREEIDRHQGGQIAGTPFGSVAGGLAGYFGGLL